MTDSGSDAAAPAAGANSSYDAVPYESYSFAHTHPDHLATIATLFGLSPPATDTARVLELGCASGGNLIPMAEAMPDASFVGIDLSKRQIDDGLALVEQTGVANVELQHRSILDVGPDDGSFDYIICHGVYSWVPPDVQAKILGICGENLAPNGIAYVSYNTFPGWHMRAMVREMMNYHAARFDDVQTKIDQSRALLDFLTSAVPDGQDAYASLLQRELSILKDRYDSYLFHEHLEEYNEPLYFYRFAERAAAAGLRYLAEAGFESMTSAGLSEPASRTLDEIAPDLIHYEQYMDFVRNRMFRRTLLCSRDLEPIRTIEPARVRDLYATSPIQPPATGCDLVSEEPSEFAHPERGSATIRKPVQKAALIHLYEIWPASLGLADLTDAALARLPGEKPTRADAEAEVEELLLTCFPAGVVELYAREPRFTTEPPERPRVTAFARHQLKSRSVCTNLRHEVSQLDELQRRAAQFLDGTRDIDEVLDLLVKDVMSGDATLHKDDEPITDVEVVRTLVGEALPNVIRHIAGKALVLR